MTKQREEQLIAANFPFLPPTPTNVIPNATVTTATIEVDNDPTTSNVAVSAAPIQAKVTTAPKEIGKDSTGSIKPKRATFKSMLDEWHKYTKEHNTMQIPTSVVKLNAWARDTRKAYRDFKSNKPSTMNKQRVEQLIAANFPLEVNISKSPVKNLPSTPSTRSLTKKKDDPNPTPTAKKRVANKTSTSPKTKKSKVDET
jgi:hypothetical protein